MICEICKKDFKNLGRHLSNNGNLVHNLNTKEYYLKFILKHKQEPKCLVCSNGVEFYGISTGFAKTCSSKCHTVLMWQSKEHRKKVSESCKLTWNKEEYKKIASLNWKKGWDKEVVKEKVKIEDFKSLKNWINSNLYSKDKYLNPCKSQTKYLKRNYLNILSEIKKYTFFLGEESSVSERIFCIVNNIRKEKRCIECNKRLKFISYSKGYNTFCSTKCSTNSKIIKEKTKNTCIKRYGGPAPISSHHIREKIKKTNLIKYGVENVLQSDLIQDKIKQVCLEKYGHPHYSKYPVDKDILSKVNDIDWLKLEHIEKQKSVLQISKEIGVSQRYLLNKFKDSDVRVRIFYKSRFEKEIVNFINIKNVETNTRKVIYPYELDIYLPDYKLAIEFDGLYWHSSNSKKTDKIRKSHLNKTSLCQEKGTQLLHVFENEWMDPIKQEVWKSIVNNKLGKNNKVYARKCEIKEIKNNSLIREFLNNNHLQGFTGSSIKLGLFYEEELVSLMTFGKTRFSKKYEWEMIRFCNKKFTGVVGGASKLFKYFINNYNPKSIISYADRRYSTGNLYEKLGFKISHNSDPNYWYFKNNGIILYSRTMFQKHKLSNLLENFNENHSESKNMYYNNYRRIWDCGNIICTWKN